MNAKSDHKNKFRELFTKEYGKLVNYIHRYVDTRLYGIDPDDIIQDIALNFFDKIDINSPIENIAAYLYRSIRNKIIDYQRKPIKDVPLESFVDEDDNNYLLRDLMEDISDVDDEHEKSELKIKLGKAIEQLKPDQQAIIVETEFEGQSFEDLSNRWNVPIGTLLSRKHRAIKKLQEIMNY